MKKLIMAMMLVGCICWLSPSYADDFYIKTAPLQEWEKTSIGKNLELKKEMRQLWLNGYKAEYIRLAIQIIVAEKIIEATKQIQK